MLTIMGIKARDMDIDLSGTRVDITKIMASEPRRIASVKVVFHFPEGLKTDEKQRSILERAAMTCPVIESLNKDMVKDVAFAWQA
jgi:uncharacterized OsmC-like protein